MTKRRYIGAGRRIQRGGAGIPTPPSGVTINTPVEPGDAGEPQNVTGNYTGLPTSISVVWRQSGSNVGDPVNAHTVAGGSWAATINRPGTPGTYTLRAAFNGTSPTADSGNVEVVGTAPVTIATFAIEGTGAPASTVAFYGQGFPAGTLDPEDSILVRDVIGSTERRVQMKVLSTWDSDGSVRAAVFAVEPPAISDTNQPEFVLRKNESHSSPGSDLSLATLLTGRSVVVKTWAPGNTTTPLWTYDVAAAVLAQGSTLDDGQPSVWMSGPLCVAKTVQTLVPSTAIQDTDGGVGSIESVRLRATIYATKDGIVEVETEFANDLMEFVTADLTSGGFRVCGNAVFGYTIEIDGVTVYDQRPSNNHQVLLFRNTAWIRMIGRDTEGQVYFATGSGTIPRPFAYPDNLLMHQSGVSRHVNNAEPLAANSIATITNIWNGGVGQQTNPYHTWGTTTSAGEAGGRPELGYRNMFGAGWQGFRNRRCALMAHRLFEVVNARPHRYYDIEAHDWVKVTTWPKFASGLSSGDSGGVAGQPKSQVTAPTRPAFNYGYVIPLSSPSGTFSGTLTGATSGAQSGIVTRIGNTIYLSPENPIAGSFQVGETVNATGGGAGTVRQWVCNRYLTFSQDNAHQAAHCFAAALFGGRRAAFEALAARACQASFGRTGRWNAGALHSGTPEWRNYAPSADTGLAWGPRLGSGQTRDNAWDFRDQVDAAAILPDDYPGRSYYTESIRAWINAYNNQIPLFQAAHFPEIGLQVPQGTDGRSPVYQLTMFSHSLFACQRLGFGGANFDTVFQEMMRFRVGWVQEATTNYRNWFAGNSITVREESTGAYAQSWAEVQSYTASFAALGDKPQNWVYSGFTPAWVTDQVVFAANLRNDVTASAQIKIWAADVLALFYSTQEYVAGSLNDNPSLDPRPTIRFARFFTDQYGNNYCHMPPGVTTRYDAAPTITPGQSFNVPGDAEDGDPIGVVLFTGNMPRNSDEGRDVGDAWVIDSQPDGDPIGLSPQGGGGLIVANAAALGTTPFNVALYCRTWQGNSATEHRSATESVLITPVITGVSISASSTTVNLPANTTADTVVVTLTYSGTEPITISEVSGDTEGLFTVAGSGNPRNVTLTGDPSSLAGQSYAVTFRATGSDTDDVVVTFNITASADPPDIADQAVSIAEGAAVGTAATPTLTNTSDAADTLTIASEDNTGSWFTATAPATISRGTGRLARAEATSRTFTLTAENAVGSDTAEITVNIGNATWVYTVASSLVIGAWSVSRRLRTNYTGNLFRATRVADGVEQDFGFDGSGVLDVDALETFAQGGRVTALPYGQSAMEQGLMSAHTGGAPYITDASGVAIKLGSNNRVALRFESARGLRWPSFLTAGQSAFAAMLAARRDFSDTTARVLVALSSTSSANPATTNTSSLLRMASSARLQGYRNGTLVSAITGTNAFTNGTAAVLGFYTLADTGYRRAVSVGSTISQASDSGTWSALDSTVHLVIGGRADSANVDWIGEIGECILTGTLNLGTDQVSVRSNMQTYFGV